MQRVVITQYGRRVSECARTFLIKLEEGVDPSELDECRLISLADNANIGWREAGSGRSVEGDDVEVDGHEVADEEADLDNYKGMPVLKWLAEESLTSEEVAATTDTTEAFVIYDEHKATEARHVEPPQSEDQPPTRAYSDEVRAANARSVYRNFMVEPIYKDGKPTGKYRVCRRWPDPCWHWGTKIRWEAVLPSREEALEWGKQHTEGW